MQIYTIPILMIYSNKYDEIFYFSQKNNLQIFNIICNICSLIVFNPTIKILKMLSLKPQSQPKEKMRPKEPKLLSNKSHYNYNSKLYDVNLNPLNNQNTTPIISYHNNPHPRGKQFEQKLGVTRMKDPIGEAILNGGEQSNIEEEVSKLSLSVDRKNNKSMADLRKSALSSTKKINSKDKDKEVKQLFRLPPIQKIANPEDLSNQKRIEIFYQSKVQRAFRLKQNTYMMNLARQHFLQSVQAIKIGRGIKLPLSPKVLNLSKKNPKFKTIFLDLDQTLIHCDQSSNNYTVRLNFPVQGGQTIQAGIKVRPYCNQFLEQLSSFAQIIIFTASARSYADVVLDYLDPKKKFFAHRLYRHHCTLEKGFYTKDLRIINRRSQDVAIVDNSAFSFMTQPEHGIPILPYYHFAKDKELPSLIKFLRGLVDQADMRQKIRKTFFWEKYSKNDEDPRKTFQQNYNFI